MNAIEERSAVTAEPSGSHVAHVELPGRSETIPATAEPQGPKAPDSSEARETCSDIRSAESAVTRKCPAIIPRHQKPLTSRFRPGIDAARPYEKALKHVIDPPKL